MFADIENSLGNCDLPFEGRNPDCDNGFRAFSESLLENIDEVFFWCNPDSIKPYFVSHAYERIWGWSCASAYAEPSSWLHAIHAEDRDRVVATYNRASIAGEVQLEYRINHGNGGIRWVFARTFPYRDASGAIKHIIGIAQDCTDRVKAHETQSFLASIVESSDDSIIGTDLNGRILSWNLGAEKLFGYKGDEVVGKNVIILFQPERVRDHSETLSKIRAYETIERFDSVRLGKDGVAIDVSVILSPIKDAFGNVHGVSAIYRDVSEKVRVEAELRNAIAAAEAANRAKSEFLANMSHEIRTPMNGIIGMTEVLLDTVLSTDQRDYLQIVKGSADLMLAVINDILDFSKIEAGRLELDAVPFNIRDHIEETEKSLALKAHEKGLELVCSVSPNVPEEVVGDTTRIRQVLANLLGNAIKFTTEGEVELNVDAERVGEKAILRFSVRDTGIGIPLDKQALIFNAFSQADGSTTRNYGGTGLGLAIAQRLVSAMGGNIWVESQPGCGSRFFFTAFLDVPDAAPQFSSTQTSLVGIRVLVVDDNVTNRLILTDLLRRWGMQPAAVSSVSEALAHLAHAADQHEPYSLVLTDLHMPGMDGFDPVEKMRTQGTSAEAFIPMLTYGEHVGDLKRCRQLGISAYLVKPVRREELRRAIITVMHGQHASGVPDTLSQERDCLSGRCARVLVVEDNLVNQRVAAAVLQKAGHQVVLASDGESAIALLERETFDVILMDVQMPGMDGFQATRVIRESQHSRGARTPIIAMTAHALSGDRERCLQAGMDDYVSKPFDCVALRRLVSKHHHANLSGLRSATGSTELRNSRAEG